MEQIVVQWFQLMLNTFNWQLVIYQQWWAWAFLAVPAIVTTIGSMIWISILVSPIYCAFSGFKWLAEAITTGRKK